MGFCVALAAMAGDLISSFIKRRLGKDAHAQAFGLDQIPEALLPLLLLQPVLGLSAVDVMAVLAAFVAGEVVASRLLFRLGIRDQPH
jgi:CDP-2,3-bis-(O-geranylgeranyl)-sn-glycerol synthase